MLVLLAVVLGTVATPVAGHAYLSESDPENGDRLDALPDDVTLTFSGDGIQLADVSVTDPDGEDVSGDAEIDGDDDRLVRVPLETEEEGATGVYLVRWEVLSDDGHTTTGSFFFSVGDDPPDRGAVLEAYADDDEGASPGAAAATALVLAGVVGLVGMPVTTWIAIYPVVGRFGVDGRAVDRRLTRLLAAVSLLLLVGVVALGFARSASLGEYSLAAVDQFLGTSLGRVWLVQVALALGVAALLGAGARGLVGRRGWFAGAVLGAVAVQTTVAWTSHSATAIDRLQGTAVAFAHAAAAGLWLGGLVVLAALLPALLERVDGADRHRFAAAVVRRYSLVALAGASVALTTGLVLAVWHAPTLEVLATTLYGTALSTKTLLVALALGLGGITRLVLLRRLESDESLAAREDGESGLDSRSNPAETEASPAVNPNAILTVTRAIRLEVAVLVLVVVLSAVLTSTPTAVMAGADHGPGEVSVAREFDGGVLELSVVPAVEERDTLYVDEGAPTVFEVAFVDADGDRVASDRPVSILARNDVTDTTLEFDLEETDDGTYATVQALPDAQYWELRATGTPDGTYVGEWVDAYAIPAGHDHGDHESRPDETGFTLALRLGAIAVGLVGSVAVVLETVRFGRRQS